MVKWVFMLYDTSESDEELWDVVSVFESMFIGYNLLINLSALPINFIVILKEFTMPFFQFLSPNAGHSDDDISLTADVELRAVDILNPMNWVNVFWTRVLGYNFFDLFRYNPENPSVYYKNWWHLGGV